MGSEKLLELTSGREANTKSSDTIKKSRISVGIIGIMTDDAKQEYANVFKQAYHAPICIAYHDCRNFRYDAINKAQERELIKARLLEDARTMKKSGVTHLLPAVLDYEPIVDELADELGLKTIKFSKTLAKNCMTLTAKTVGVVGLTNDCSSNAILNRAISEATVGKTEKIGVKQLGGGIVSSFGCVQDLSTRQQEYVEEIIRDITFDRRINAILLSCPELHVMCDTLKARLAALPRRIVVWSTIHEQEFILRFPDMAAKE